MRYLIAFVWCVFFSVSAFAQDRATPTDPCEQINEETVALDKVFLDCHVPTVADYIHEIHKGINGQRKGAKTLARANYEWDQIIQWTLMILAFLTTIFTALAKSYPSQKFFGLNFDLAFLPIIFAALVTLTTSVSAYYNFQEKVERDRSVSMDIATLMTDMIVKLRSDVAIKKAIELGEISSDDSDVPKRKTTEEWLAETDAWMKRLEEALRRYHPEQSLAQSSN